MIPESIKYQEFFEKSQARIKRRDPRMLSTLLTDFYKIGHINQYPAGTQKVYSNLTARKSRNQDIDKVVFFGLQYFMKKYLVEDFKTNFFSKTREKQTIF